MRIRRECAAKAIDLNPLNIEFALAELAPLAASSPAALCAFDLAFHDLLGVAAGLPLYRLLGGYRNRIMTSITVPMVSNEETVEISRRHARNGFRILKLKGGEDPDLDVQRVQSVHRALPDHILRLDADGGYSVRQSLDVARALKGVIEVLEQPTPASNIELLCQVSNLSPVPILADQSASDPESVLKIASGRCAQSLSIKLAACGGLNSARQLDSIARAARISTMVGCLIEPAILIAAGLSFALSSPNVSFGDLDGHLHLLDDPSSPGFSLRDGWLTASDVPGLGYAVNLG